ncbi:MAG: zinc-dependent alcohol dehydrogenase [Candidatus Thorarchaeota archaeon]|jgi:threonine dehydrogenase-like Zn-dependent dehydrogenase
MKGIFYDLKRMKLVLKKMKLGRKYSMIKFREDWDIPEISHPNQIQVKSRFSGICTSDLHQIDVNMPYSATILARKINPIPLGHEVVGEVTQLGEDVEGLEIGDRVVHSPVVHCEAYGFEPCPSCQRGYHESCYSIVGVGDGSELEDALGGRGGFGGFSGGGFSEYFVGFAKQFTKVPDTLPDELAVLSEPFAVGLHAVAKNRPDSGDTVLVIGAGIIGLMIIASIRHLVPDCRIITLARYPFQAEAAKKLGSHEVIMEAAQDELYDQMAELTGGTLLKPILGKRILYGNTGPDIIYDSIGTGATMDHAFHLVRSNGRIVLVGMEFSDKKKTDRSLQVYKEISVIGSMMHGLVTVNGETVESMEKVLEIINENQAMFEGLVTHKYTVDEYKSAFQTSAHKGKHGAIKVAFEFPQTT